MPVKYVPTWKKAPFIRALVPLMLGILLQWYLQPPIEVAWWVFGIVVLGLSLSFLLSYYSRYKIRTLAGIAVSIIFVALGSFLTWYKNIQHNHRGYSRHAKADLVVATLQEPPVHKTNSYKALASVTAIRQKKRFTLSEGKLIIYFQKDSGLVLDYGSQVVFSKALQNIRNAGNPGGFDYKRYCLFQDVTHQVYLRRSEFVVLEKKNEHVLGRLLFAIKAKVLFILRRYIHAEKEKGLAEALLIGYKDDLDKNLVQSYTNTGVVHVIAISGLHLGLIYWLLVQLLKPLRKARHLKWLIPVTIISALWLFSLIAGGQPSVLRSAVMFTCIVLGENLSRRTSIYNTLAVSAFILLCFNPFWLWDVGFQLSYVAVLSIVIFMKPIYDLFYIKNRMANLIWKVNAVSIAAQLLTTPFSVYHFHQFPNYFLLTNFVAVPLSSLILIGEIFLCIASFIPFIAVVIGKILSWLIWLMNFYIERIESLPYSLSDGLQIGIVQAVLLIVIVAGFGHWLLEKQKATLWVALFALLLIMFLRSLSFYKSNQQQKIIVYNVPRCQAIDLISGRHYFFIGDSLLLNDELMTNFNLRPSRILYRATSANHLPNVTVSKHFLQFGSKRILLIHENLRFHSGSNKVPLDLLVISKNPRIQISTVSKVFYIKQIVIDASVPSWKLKSWVKECDSLRIPCHDVTEGGAFVMNLN